MSTLQLNLTRQLARTVRFTERMKTRPAQSRAASAIARLVDFLARGVFYVWRNRQYLTVLKVTNMALVNVQFWLKTEYVIGRPYSMKIESTNICNTKCQLCPTGLGMLGRPRGKMPIEQFKQLIDRTRRHLFSLDLSMWGDPLIVPDIYDMIRYAHDRGIWTYISSNLHAFKLHPKPGEKSQAESLVESGLDMLTCSLHGASQTTYELYQPGKRFDEAVAKVRQIVETRDRLGSATPAIQLNFVVTKHNEHERAAFQRLADELGCRAVFSNASMNIRFLGKDKQLHDLGLAPDMLEKKVMEHLNHWLPRNRDYVLQPYQDLLAGQATQHEAFNGRKVMDCSWPWRATVVNWDGQVVTCCGSFDPAEDMGSVFDKGLGSIWNSEKYRMARRSFKKKLSDNEAKDNPCATCPGFML